MEILCYCRHGYININIKPFCVLKAFTCCQHWASVSMKWCVRDLQGNKFPNILEPITADKICQISHHCHVRFWLRDLYFWKSVLLWLLKQTPARQQIIHTDHGIGGMLLTQLISPLLIRQTLILRPLNSSIMYKMTEVGLQSEEGVPRDKDWKRNRLQRVNLGA